MSFLPDSSLDAMVCSAVLCFVSINDQLTRTLIRNMLVQLVYVGHTHLKYRVGAPLYENKNDFKDGDFLPK